jgi:hypothetical protein
MAVEPVALTIATSDHHRRKAGRHVAEPGAGALEQGLDGECGQRRLFRRLPDTGVAADDGQRRVPRPDGHREVERRDDPNDAQRMPGLHHPMVRALGGDGQTKELAREADRVVADVDHLLDFAQGLGRDLAGLEGDERAEVGLGGAQFLAEQPHEFAAARRGDIAPGPEGGVGRLDRRRHARGVGVMDVGQGLAGDGRAHGAASAGPRPLGDGQSTQDLGGV